MKSSRHPFSEVDRLMGCLIFSEDIIAARSNFSGQQRDQMEVETLTAAPVNEFFDRNGDCQKVWDKLIQEFREMTLKFTGLPKHDPLLMRYF